MALRHMRVWTYVEEVARAGSIRRAAERLNIAGSAILRRIQDVERDLGVAIFERGHDGMRLTASGEAFVAWIRAQTAGLDDVRSRIEALRGLQSGHVRIACSQAMATAFLPREIALFHRRHPGVGFAVSMQDHSAAAAALLGYDTDLALVFRMHRDPGLRVLQTVPQGLIAIMAADHPLAAQNVVRLSDCAAYPLALPSVHFASRVLIDAALPPDLPRPSPALEANSFELLRNFVRYSRAVTFQAAIGAPDVAAAADLAVRPVDRRDIPAAPLVLAQRAGRELPAAVAAFAEHLGGALDQLI